MGEATLSYRRWTAILVLWALMVGLQPAPATAWGFAVHRFVTGGAIDRLPDELRTFFLVHREFVSEHSIDPDLWRRVGFDEEPPRHFLNLDAYGDPPFHRLPRDLDAAIRAFGTESVTKNGTLPWRVREIFERLTGAFEATGKGTAPFAVGNVTFYAAVLSHYVADAHVPFHALTNHDGQFTGQRGIHARFETELFLRHRERLRIAPRPLVPAEDPVDFVFEILLASFELAESILDADRAARHGREAYDTRYFATFFEAVQPTLEGRLGAAMTSVASLLVASWEAAGRPVLPARSTR